MSSHLSNRVPRSRLLSPTFSVSVRLPHDVTSPLKNTTPTSVNSMISSWVSTFTGQYGPFLTLLLLGSTNPLRYDHVNARILISSSLGLDLSSRWLLFTLFSRILILIGSDRDVHFTSALIYDDRFLSFRHTRELSSSFVFDTYDDFYVFLTCFPLLCLPCLPWQDDLVPRTSGVPIPLRQRL